MAGRYHQAMNASERFGYSRYVDPSPGLTGPVGRYHQAASLVAVPDGRIAGTTMNRIVLEIYKFEQNLTSATI